VGNSCGGYETVAGAQVMVNDRLCMDFADGIKCQNVVASAPGSSLDRPFIVLGGQVLEASVQCPDRQNNLQTLAPHV
jgi:hypothetical protein